MDGEKPSYSEVCRRFNGVIMGTVSLVVCVVVTLSVHGANSAHAKTCSGAKGSLNDTQSTGIKFFIFITATLVSYLKNRTPSFTYKHTNRPCIVILRVVIHNIFILLLR